jgi:hypothetical protein
MTKPMHGTTAREGSLPMPANAPHRALEWSGLHFRPPITSQPISRWRTASALFVLLLHIALFGGLMFHRVQFPDAKIRRIEVSFIERVAEPALPAEESVAPPALRPSNVTPVGDARRRPAMQAVEVSPQELASLRLHLTADPWQQPDTPPEQNPLARRPSARLPGRAEPFVEGFRFSQNTPEEVLRSIAIQHFGGVDPNPCPGARERLANLGSNLDRDAIDADLRKVERYCRP